MEETVRDAVFGNVGTVISFRVSADDSPILAKQFEPQFEPNDLLQMHNRNFIINMVINGEKAPAFSAKTLNLPAAQDDNTGRIIQWTRDNYSRNRSDIEADIANRILPPENLVVKKPGPAYTPPKTPEQRAADRAARQAAKQPQEQTQPIAKQPSVKLDKGAVGLLQIDHGQNNKDTSKAAKDNDTAKTAIAADKPATNEEPEKANTAASEKPKRKRTRSRRRKTPATATSNS